VTTLNILFDKVSRRTSAGFTPRASRFLLWLRRRNPHFITRTSAWISFGLTMWALPSPISGGSRNNEQLGGFRASACGSAPTWQDPDGDGRDNLTEYALGTDPLHPDTPLAPESDFVLPGANARTPRRRVSTGRSISGKLEPVPDGDSPELHRHGCMVRFAPYRRFLYRTESHAAPFKFPVNSPAKKFYRLRFEVKQ